MHKFTDVCTPIHAPQVVETSQTLIYRPPHALKNTPAGRNGAPHLTENKVVSAHNPVQLTGQDRRGLAAAAQGVTNANKRPGSTGTGSAHALPTPANHGSSVAAVPAQSKEAPINSTSKATGSTAQASESAPLPKIVQQQRSDRLVAFLATLVTYPFMFLLTKSATAASLSRISAVMGGGGIDTRKRLADFPEGGALLELERCDRMAC